MMFLFVIVALVVIGLIAVLALGKFGQLSDPAIDRRPLPNLESDPSKVDIRSLRFTIAARGYRMDEVDAVLAAAQARLDDQRIRIAELEARQRPPVDPAGGLGADSSTAPAAEAKG